MAKDEKVYFKVHTPNLLQEIMCNSGTGALKIPLRVLQGYLIKVAERAIELNDTQLNLYMCEMSLYGNGDPCDKEAYDPKVIEQLKAQLKKEQKLKKQSVEQNLKTKIFAMYLFNKCIEDNKIVNKFTIYGINRDYIQNVCNSNTLDLRTLTLFLTSLEKITEEDCVMVARLKKKNIFEKTDADTPRTIKGLREFGLGITICKSWCWEGYLYLLSKGYALPVMGYTVEQLIELNIYKLI